MSVGYTTSYGMPMATRRQEKYNRSSGGCKQTTASKTVYCYGCLVTMLIKNKHEQEDVWRVRCRRKVDMGAVCIVNSTRYLLRWRSSRKTILGFLCFVRVFTWGWVCRRWSVVLYLPEMYIGRFEGLWLRLWRGWDRFSGFWRVLDGFR